MSEKRGLSPDDRELLLGLKEYEHDTTEANAWQRVRDRVERMVLDGRLLWQRLPPEHRRQIFEQPDRPDELWELDLDLDKIEQIDLENLDEASPDQLEELERAVEHREELRQYDRDPDQFRDSLVGFLAFLYVGIEESPDLDFDSIFRDALVSAANYRGEVPVPGTYRPPQLDTEEGFDTDKLLTKFKLREPLSLMEELHLRREADLTQEDWDRYNNRPDGAELNGGFMSEDELAEFIEEHTDEPDGDE